MADFGQQVAGGAVNTGVGMAVDRTLGRSVPLPSFYNGNSQHPFRDSQAMRMLHGDGNAWNKYGHKAAAFGIDAGLMATPVGIPNQIVKLFGGLMGKNWSLGNLAARLIPDGTDNTVGTVGGTPATTTSTSSDTGDIAIDPWTGEQIASSGSGGPSMPSFNYGPWAQGYQGLPDDGSSPTMPDFSNYSDQFTGPADSEYAGPYAGGGSGEGGGDGGMGGMGAGGGWGMPGGGTYGGGWNGASGNMMTDFAATQNGDFTNLVSRQHGMQGLPKQGASRR